MSAPTLASVKAYLGDDSSWSDTEIQEALDAETEAQLSRCSFTASYPADIAQALCRRVARNLAARRMPLGFDVQMSEGGGVVARVGHDAEIARLEAPYRRLVVG